MDYKIQVQADLDSSAAKAKLDALTKGDYKIKLQIDASQLSSLNLNSLGKQASSAGETAGRNFASSMQKQISSVQKSISNFKYESTVTKMTSQIGKYSGQNNDWLKRADAAKKEYESSYKEIDSLLKQGLTLDDDKVVKAYDNMTNAGEKFQNSMAAVNSEMSKNLRSGEATKMGNEVKKYYESNSKALKEYGDELKKVEQLGRSAVTIEDKANWRNQFNNVKSAISADGLEGRSIFAEVGRGFKQIAQFVGTYGALQEVSDQIRKMIDNVKELDDQLLELSKVSDLSASGLKNITTEAYDIGGKVGKTGTEVLAAITSFKRAGYDIKESKMLAEEALKTTNISENITNSGTAADNLVHIIKGYKQTADFAKTINNEINEVSNTQAIDFDNLVDGAERLSAVAEQSGLSFEEMLGTLTGGYEIMGNMEKTSSGLITIFTRLRSIEMEGGEEVKTSAKLQETFSDATKGTVNIIDQQTGQLRNTYDVLKDLAGIWDTLDANTREALAFEAAGTRQKSVFLSVMSNWSAVEKAKESALNSDGSADIENDKYLNSLSGKIEKFKSQFEELSSATISSDFLKGAVDGATGLLNVLTEVVKIGNGIPLVLGAIGGISFFKNLDWAKHLPTLFYQSESITIQEAA